MIRVILENGSGVRLVVEAGMKKREVLLPESSPDNAATKLHRAPSLPLALFLTPLFLRFFRSFFLILLEAEAARRRLPVRKEFLDLAS